MPKRARYTLNQVSNDRYFQMPKFLFEGEFTSLSNNARVLYSLLKDRHSLSIKNEWINKHNEVYLIYTRKDMQKMLGLADKTTKKAVEQLKEYGLLEEERIGCNRANRIYLTAIDIEITGVVENTIPEKEDLRFKNRSKYDSEDVENTIQESYNLRPNNTDINDTDFSDLDLNQSINQDEMDRLIHTTKKDTKTANSDHAKYNDNIINDKEVVKELTRNKEIPYRYCSNKEHMKIAIHYLSGYNKTQTFYDDEIKDSSFKLAINTLVEMATTDQIMNIGGSKISYKNVIDKINEAITEEYNILSIDRFLNEVVGDFVKALKNKDIKNLVAYMRSCIWNSLINHEVQFHATLQRLINEV